MAITLHQQPSEFSPAYNNLIYLVVSTNKAQPNFRYVFDVYEGTGTTRLARLKVPAEPDTGNGFGVCDISRIIQDYVSHDLPTFTGAFARNSNSYKDYLVKFGEEYGSTPSGYYSLLTGSKRYAFNGCIDFLDFPDYDQADYLMAEFASTPFLTNAPDGQEIYLDQLGWVSMMTSASGEIGQMRVKRYDANGVQLDDTVVDNAFDPITTDADRFLRFPAGTKNLDTLLTASPYNLGSMEASGVASYTLQTRTSPAVDASSELRTYNIVTPCNRGYTNYRLHWLNKLGGWDSFNFELASRQRIDIERKEYKKTVGSITGTTWGYDADERGRTQYDTRVKEMISVTSDWMSDANMTWMQELIASPEVYLESPAGVGLVPVILDANSFDVKKKINEKLINVEVTFGYAHDNIRQRS